MPQLHHLIDVMLSKLLEQSFAQLSTAEFSSSLPRVLQPGSSALLQQSWAFVSKLAGEVSCGTWNSKIGK